MSKRFHRLSFNSHRFVLQHIAFGLVNFEISIRSSAFSNRFADNAMRSHSNLPLKLLILLVWLSLLDIRIHEKPSVEMSKTRNLVSNRLRCANVPSSICVIDFRHIYLLFWTYAYHKWFQNTNILCMLANFDCLMEIESAISTKWNTQIRSNFYLNSKC